MLVNARFFLASSDRNAHHRLNLSAICLPTHPASLLHQFHTSEFPPRCVLRFLVHLTSFPLVRAPPSPNGSASRRDLLPASYAARNSTCHLHGFFASEFRLLPYFIYLLPPLLLGCSTPAIASESCDHFERSLVNCFLPAAVS